MIISFVSFFVFSGFAFAYTRIPVGDSITSPVTISFYRDDPTSDMPDWFQVGFSNVNYYSIDPASDTTDYYGTCFPVNETDLKTDIFNFSVGETIKVISLQGFTDSNCQNVADDGFGHIAFKNFEGDGAYTIFTIIQNIQTASVGLFTFVSATDTAQTGGLLSENVLPSISSLWPLVAIILTVPIVFYILHEIIKLFNLKDKKRKK